MFSWPETQAGISNNKKKAVFFNIQNILTRCFSLSYRYLKILGEKNKEKMPIPTTSIRSAGCQWFILNTKPRLVNETEIAPVINANFFIYTIFILSPSMASGNSPVFEMVSGFH